jgi:hypothetical protein
LDGDGLTISGGEPLDQNHALFPFIRKYKDYCGKPILLFTGYTVDEIFRSSEYIRTILSVDSVISGRYVKGAIWEGKKLLEVTGRIPQNDLKPTWSIEIGLSDTQLYLSGYPNQDICGGMQ